MRLGATMVRVISIFRWRNPRVASRAEIRFMWKIRKLLDRYFICIESAPRFSTTTTTTSVVYKAGGTMGGKVKRIKQLGKCMGKKFSLSSLSCLKKDVCCWHKIFWIVVNNNYKIIEHTRSAAYLTRVGNKLISNIWR